MIIRSQGALTKKYALQVAIAAVGIGFAFLFTEIGKRYFLVRSSGLLLAFVCWVLVLIPWYMKYKEVDVLYEQRGFYKALYAWAVTDIAVAIAMIPIGQLVTS